LQPVLRGIFVNALDGAGRDPHPFPTRRSSDLGETVDSMKSRLAAAADSIDVWKFGWGTAYIDPMLEAKLDLLRAADIRSCLGGRSEEHTSELQSREKLVCRLLLAKKNNRGS